MKILIQAKTNIAQELSLKLEDKQLIIQENSDYAAWTDDVDIIINDATFDVEKFEFYYQNFKGILIVNGVTQSLAKLMYSFSSPASFCLIGMSLIPGFINRNLVEWSIYNEPQKPQADALAKALNWQVKWVADRIGMVSPRVVCMIINEACYTLQEKVASIEDIDLGMQLGTNYPMGPFLWADKMGIESVYNILEMLYQDTHDERYKICPLLKSMYLRKETFYSLKTNV